MTKEKFEAYKEVQESGQTNMFAFKNVIALANIELTKEDIMDIMKNYGKYKKEYE